MGQISPCLKRVFTIFNILFAVVGGVILALTLLSQVVSAHGQELQGRSTGLAVMYFMGSAIMVIAILGAFGAHKENKVALIVFLVCMVTGSVLMLRVAIPSVINRPNLEEMVEEKFQKVLPLDRASSEVQYQAIKLQETFHCCGLFSYTDWESNIPDSCLCDPQEMDGCRMAEMQHTMVYSQTCFPIVMQYLTLAADIILGVLFTSAVLALLGMAMSSVMIHQIDNTSKPTMVLTVPTVFSSQPPKYQEIYNTPGY